MLRIVATVVAWACPFVFFAQTREQPVGLQRALFEEALSAGRSGPVRPYDLRESGHVNGAVYTPFVRVAMLSRAARMRGEELSLANVPPSVYEPLTYFVMRWSEEHDWPRVFEYSSRQPLRVAMVPSGYGTDPPGLHDVRPAWTTEDVGVLARFGAEKPFEDAAVVAAFPVEAVKAGFDVVAFVTVLGEKQPLPPGVKHKTIVRIGRITSEELAEWR